MKSLRFKDDSPSIPPEVLKVKLAIGRNFGVITGMAFAIANWGMDGYYMSQAHVLLPWLKLILGILICGIAGGLAGFFTTKFDRWSLSILLWIGVGVVFAWTTVLLPLRFASTLSEWFKPQLKGLLTVSTFDDLYPRFWIALAWMLIFVFMVGVLQLPAVEPAAFSTSLFGRIAPYMLGIIIMAISGTVTDTLINKPLREAALALNSTVQFVIDHKDIEVDPLLSRTNHTASLRTVKDQVTQSRLMVISQHDPTLGEIHMVILFEGSAVDCSV